MSTGQRHHFGIADTTAAEAAGVSLTDLHTDVDAIIKAWDAVKPVAERLGVQAAPPHLAGFSYSHISALGCPIEFAEGSEPNVVPIIKTPEDIDHLREPDNYLEAGIMPQRLRTMEKLCERRPEAGRGVGKWEGPLTTAMLMMGDDFATLPYTDPERAHRLLDFVVESTFRYQDAMDAYYGVTRKPARICIADDFAGFIPAELFGEFVLPYWDRIYTGFEATYRYLHSELLRHDHLDQITGIGVQEFDPSADQYVTPESLRDRCPVPFHLRIQEWHIENETEEELQAHYRHLADHGPKVIEFYMARAHHESKIAAIFEVARELENAPQPA